MIHLEHVSYAYPETEAPVLADLSLKIEAGEFVLVTGPSGSGKSTFLRSLNGLAPHFTGGRIGGKIAVDGLNPTLASPRIMSRLVGFVFQNPETQFVMDSVEDEIAFALENAAVPAQEIGRRIEWVLSYLGMGGLRARALHTLSGGERQKAAIAAALVLKPKILALDEPTSQLDPRSASEVLDLLVRLRAESGLTIVLVEHRLERVLPYADRLIYFPGDSGRVLSGKPAEILSQVPEAPPLARVGTALGWQPLPLDLEASKAWVARTPALQAAARQAEQAQRAGEGEREAPTHPIYQVENLSVLIGSKPILQQVSLQVYAGEILALVGANGAGKTTLLRAMTGLQKASAGRIFLDGQDASRMEVAEICRRVGFLPQDPNALLFADEVQQELEITLRNHDLPVDRELIEQILRRLDLQDHAKAYPRQLSTGQRQRAALAALLVTQPTCLLLDEPTRGLDSRMKDALGSLLKQLAQAGGGILLVTHDVELAARAADRVAVMQSGQIAASGEPYAVLSRFPEFSTQVMRLFPGSGWLTPEDVLERKAG